MDQENIAKSITDARNKAGLTQQELADKCNLNIRTIQRIEAGEVVPRCYTVRILSEALEKRIDYPTGKEADLEEQHLRRLFLVRKKIRIATFASAMTILLITGIILIVSPNGELFGLSKREWTPIVYFLMFAHLIGLGIYWRCPACNHLLGDVFNIRRCGHCGLRFYE